MSKITPLPAQESIPAVSEAEWEVMRVLWAKAPQTTNQVVEALTPLKSWKPKTIHTLLRRLVEKKALEAEKQGREFSYTPRVSEAECQTAETRSFLGRFFAGGVVPFLAAFVEQEKLTAAEVAELKRILEGAK